MDHSPAYILQTYLIAQGLVDNPEGTNPTWPAYRSGTPSEPDQVVVFYNTGGNKDGREMPTGKVIEHPGIQVKVRARKDTEAFLKASALASALDALYNAAVTIEGKNYKIEVVHRPSPILSMGLEEGQRRYLYSINATMTVKEIVP